MMTSHIARRRPALQPLPFEVPAPQIDRIRASSVPVTAMPRRIAEQVERLALRTLPHPPVPFGHGEIEA